MALAFNAMGYHAFVLEYSTCFGHKARVDLAQDPRVDPGQAYLAPLQEVALAIAKIHAFKDQWQVDTDQLILCGFQQVATWLLCMGPII